MGSRARVFNVFMTRNVPRVFTLVVKWRTENFGETVALYAFLDWSSITTRRGYFHRYNCMATIHAIV